MNRLPFGTLATILLIGLFWGLNWPAIKFLLNEQIPPFTIRVYAFTIAGAALLAYAVAIGDRLIPPVWELPWMALAGLLTIFGFNMLTTLGQILTDTSKAAIIAYTMPALTAFFSVIFLRERLRLRLILSLVIGMTGIALLVVGHAEYLLKNPLGPAIMLASATVWALGTVAMKARQFTLPPIALTTWFMGLSALACWPFALILEDPLGMPIPSTPALAVWLWHALLPMVVCYALWTRLVARVSAPLAAIATLLAPVVGVSSAVILLGDTITWHKVAALVLVLGSIVLTFLGPRAGRSSPSVSADKS